MPHKSKAAEWPQEDAVHFSTHLHKDISEPHQTCGDVVIFAATVDVVVAGYVPCVRPSSDQAREYRL